MASIVTGVINGFQGSSAAHNAGAAAAAGDNKAAGNMADSVNNAGTTLANAANTAVSMGTDAGGNAENLALGTQATGAANLTNTAATGANAATAAGTAAGQGVTDAATAAGAGVTGAAADANGLLNPYITHGAQASDNLATAMGPGGSLAPKSASDIMQNDPGYQFQLQQGKQALARAAAASGQSGSGAFLKSLGNYATGAAQSGYQQAFSDTLAQQNQQYNQMKGVADSGAAAATTAGGQKMAGAEYAGNAGMTGAEYAGNAGMQTSEFGSTMNTNAAAANAASGNQAAQYAGNAGIQTNEYAGDALMKSGSQMSSNDMQGGAYEGNMYANAGNATAAGDMGAAKAWSGALDSIGNGVDSFITGGWGGGGGFNLGGAMTGNPKYGM
jgi:hypothetical protein